MYVLLLCFLEEASQRRIKKKYWRKSVRFTSFSNWFAGWLCRKRGSDSALLVLKTSFSSLNVRHERSSYGHIKRKESLSLSPRKLVKVLTDSFVLFILLLLSHVHVRSSWTRRRREAKDPWERLLLLTQEQYYSRDSECILSIVRHPREESCNRLRQTQNRTRVIIQWRRRKTRIPGSKVWVSCSWTDEEELKGVHSPNSERSNSTVSCQQFCPELSCIWTSWWTPTSPTILRAFMPHLLMKLIIVGLIKRMPIDPSAKVLLWFHLIHHLKPILIQFRETRVSRSRVTTRMVHVSQPMKRME